jgi:hypothetical protein
MKTIGVLRVHGRIIENVQTNAYDLFIFGTVTPRRSGAYFSPRKPCPYQDERYERCGGLGERAAGGFENVCGSKCSGRPS